jgi:tetratricopeptide (TPR) repeat protein
MRRVAVAVVVVAVLLSVQSLAVAQSDAVKEVTVRMQAGDYKEALKVIAKQLETTPRNAQDERYELLMLRGECQIQSAQWAAARATFDLAATLATDVKRIAEARGTAVLIRSTSEGKYRAQGTNTAVIDIVKPDSRREAFEACRIDKANAIMGKYDKAMQGTTLKPMTDLLPALLDLGYLEYSGAGKATETREQIKAMGERARELMNEEIKRIRYKAGALSAVAHSQYDGMSRGLHSNERKELRDDVTYLRQIEKTGRDVRRRAIELGFDGKAWEPVIADSGDLADRLEAIVDVGP